MRKIKGLWGLLLCLALVLTVGVFTPSMVAEAKVKKVTAYATDEGLTNSHRIPSVSANKSYVVATEQWTDEGEGYRATRAYVCFKAPKAGTYTFKLSKLRVPGLMNRYDDLMTSVYLGHYKSADSILHPHFDTITSDDIRWGHGLDNNCSYLESPEYVIAHGHRQYGSTTVKATLEMSKGEKVYICTSRVEVPYDEEQSMLYNLKITKK